MANFLKKLFGSSNEAEIKRLRKILDKVNALEPKMHALRDEELRALTPAFKDRLQKGETLDDLLPEAFAAVREAAVRAIGQRPFDVQVLGGIVLHQGRIAEMKTGEGKTVTCVMPAYLNALTGKGVHIVTVNDYLAKYQGEWMSKIYRFLGMSVGLILSGMSNAQRRASYACDIVYGTNNEFGFDYLRDNMVVRLSDVVQRDLNYCIVDEVDSILIDEARTPLIISGQGDKATDLYAKANAFVLGLRPGKVETDEFGNETQTGDYVKDEKDKTVNLTAEGVTKAERFFNVENLSDLENTDINHHIQVALKAHALMHRDIDYVVKDGEVLIVDEFTGRLMVGRRYSDGLHQAIEAKEHVKVEAATQTFATITLQNYFRMYHKLAGMTGTAETEASEFWSIYKLDVVVIPTNRPVIRDDRQDLIYKTKREKYNAVIEEIVKLVEAGRPVLVGTTSVEISELLSRMLKLRGIKHNVLNAKQHQLEAQVVAEAGRSGQVTIATNMAGRGTDIKLTPEVKAAGGLAIIGTERHESRRVDRQLRGRAGRQGDPGSSQFFVSLEDDLMRLFGSGRIASMMDRMGLKEGEVIQAGMMTRAIERAQKKVEENNFGIRKRLLEYDDVMNSQREVIYTRRRHALYGERIEIDLNNIMYDYADNFVEVNRGIEFEDFRFELIREVAIEPSFDEATYGSAKPAELAELIVKDLKDAYARRAKSVADTVRPVMERIYEDRKEQLDSNIYFPITDGHLGYNVPVNLLKCKNSDGAEIFRVFSKVVMFTSIDDAWREHLREMDDLRQSVQNATYEQKDPLLIYKFESFGLFSKMIVKVNRDVLAILNKAYIPVRDQNAEAVQRERQERAKVDVNKLQASRMQAAAQAGQQDKQKPMPLHVEKKVGRNDPCPCGSGKKYKQCHGKGI